jgi:hypothetical protein
VIEGSNSIWLRSLHSGISKMTTALSVRGRLYVQTAPDATQYHPGRWESQANEQRLIHLGLRGIV